MRLYKCLAVVAALSAALGYGSDKIEWLKLGAEVSERISSQPENWKDILPETLEWVGMGGADEVASNPPTKDSKHTTSQRVQSYSGRVTRVSDGDTLHVTDSNGRKHKIRMAHIDAPELQQAYGTRSRDSLKAVAEGEKVTVRIIEIDRYRREVAQVWKGDTDLNLLQVRQGAAWHYERYAKKQQSKQVYSDYAAAQKQARSEGKGLWRSSNPQAPWDFRRAQNSQSNSQNNADSKQWFGSW